MRVGGLPAGRLNRLTERRHRLLVDAVNTTMGLICSLDA